MKEFILHLCIMKASGTENPPLKKEIHDIRNPMTIGTWAADSVATEHFGGRGASLRFLGYFLGKITRPASITASILTSGLIYSHQKRWRQLAYEPMNKNVNKMSFFKWTIIVKMWLSQILQAKSELKLGLCIIQRSTWAIAWLCGFRIWKSVSWTKSACGRALKALWGQPSSVRHPTTSR